MNSEVITSILVVSCLELHSSSTEPAGNFFGTQSSLGGGAQFSFGGAQFSFGGARAVIWGVRFRNAPPWRRA